MSNDYLEDFLTDFKELIRYIYQAYNTDENQFVFKTHWERSTNYSPIMPQEQTSGNLRQLEKKEIMSNLILRNIVVWE